MRTAIAATAMKMPSKVVLVAEVLLMVAVLLSNGRDA
jgi:hypothetical protein